VKRLALHTCCAPCLIEPLRLLREDFERIVAAYCNPNIYPLEEYGRRRDAFIAYAQSQDLSYVEFEYEPDAWSDATRGVPDTLKRCEQCYRIRFERVIKWADEQGCTHFATTLTISPYQSQELIEKLASELCERYKLIYAGYDFSQYYSIASRKSRELGMYRQNYCGCELGRHEAQAQREARAKE